MGCVARKYRFAPALASSPATDGPPEQGDSTLPNVRQAHTMRAPACSPAVPSLPHMTSPLLRRAALAGGVAAILLAAGCARQPAPADPQLVAQWLRTSLAFVRSERLGPPVAARISAYG